jgi:Site-specific recombinases, DNA invertase Pin homologs
MLFGYARVSTKEQNEDRQLLALLKYVPQDNIYIDYFSGKNFDRDNWKILVSRLRAGDELFVHELDRLGRNKKEIIKNIRHFQSLGVILRIMNIETTMINLNQFQNISTSIIEMINNLLIEVLSTIAETELIFNKKRQAEGIKNAKAKGKYKGRKPSKRPSDFSTWYRLYKKNEITKKRFCELCNFKSYKTLNKHILEFEKFGEQTIIDDFI